MYVSTFDQMKREIGWTERDAERIVALARDTEPLVPKVVDRFYDELLQHAGPRAVLTRGAVKIDRLRGTLCEWFAGLFSGQYDEAYFAARQRIGQVHVEVGLPQWYMIVGIQIIWNELGDMLRKANVQDLDAKLQSLHRLLQLELGVMLDSYKDRYAEQVRRDEQSVMEEKLTRAEHLAEIGQLAASLAHEIKNPLAGISGAVQIIGDSMGEAHPHQPIVHEILSQIRRLDAAVMDLLVYASPVPPNTSEADLNAVIQRVLRLLNEEPALQRVRVEHGTTDGLPPVHLDERQIEQLLINLVLNAAHASSEGGLVRIDVERDINCIRLVVEDQGHGMPPHVRARAFEPFFTTKAKGTGLGLCICRRIAEAHGGCLELESVVSRGTRAIVELPIYTRPPDLATTEEPA